MTAGVAEPTPASGVVCPWLGLADDPATHFQFPSGGHRCHARDRPAPIDLTTQGATCLTGRHVDCPRFRPVRSTAVAAVAVRPAPARRSPARGAILTAVLVVAAVAGVFIGASLAAGIGADPAPPATAPAVVAPAGTSPAPASPVATPTSTPTATPRSTPAATPTAAPTPSPSPAPETYVVQRGDSLTSIALRYGVTVAQLQALNGIEDPNLIEVGQTLAIPSN